MYCVYDNSTGAFVGYGRLADQLDPTGLSEKEIADVYLHPVHWDTVTRDFVNDFDEAISMTVYDFLIRFTSAERIAIETAANTDSVVNDFLFMLNHAPNDHVELNNPVLVAGVQYFASVGLIDASRVAPILGE